MGRPHFAGRTSRVTLGALLGLIVSNGLVFRPCRAQTRDHASAPETPLAEARQRYQHALALFEQGDHRAALVEFREAYRLAPSFRILYNIALVNVALDDSAAAIQAFENYLQEGGANVPRERSEEAERLISRLAHGAASLTLDVPELDARVFVDALEVGRSPLLRRVWLNPGRHSVSVRGDDGQVETRVVDAVGGDQRVLSFAPPPLKPADATASPQATPVDVASSKSHGWIPYAITGALGAAAIATGSIALVEFGHEQALKERKGVLRGDLQDAGSSVEHWALATDLLIGATAIAGGVSIYLALRPHPRAHAATFFVSPPARVSIQWSF